MQSMTPPRRSGYLGGFRSIFWFVPGVVFVVLGVQFATDGAWVEALVYLALCTLWGLTTAWRVKSGIPTWSLMATVVGLITGIRPTKDGLTRPRSDSKPAETRPKTRELRHARPATP